MLDAEFLRAGRSAVISALLLLAPSGLLGQSPGQWESVLARLDRLESENRQLRQEIEELRRQVGASHPAAEEKLEIHDRRIEEQSQTKVESSQRFPLRVTGMALFNVFLNSRFAGGGDNPPLASRTAGSATGGATFRQTVIGLEYRGPESLWGGKVRGSIHADFFGGTTDPLNHVARVRTASIELDWGTRSLLVGQEKPIIAPREPNSLAQAGISPLTGAGNLWRWQPQVRFEQRVKLSDAARLAVQLGLVQVNDEAPATYSEYGVSVSRRRPGLQGRFLLSRTIDDTRRIEIAPGFHTSVSHVNGFSAPSHVFSLDWSANPWAKLDFSGAFFAGQNVGHFGAPRQGFTFMYDRLVPVRSRGGWAQVALLATSRLTFNLMGGRHDDRNADLLPGMVGKNMAGAANLMYRLAPNVILALEALQVRTDYLGTGTRINNHYDLAVAYLF